MPTYSYTAVNESGGTAKGKVTASNEFDLEERLREQDLMLLTFKAEKKSKGGLLGGKIGVKELIMLCVHLEQLDKAGVPLLDALADMRDSADSAGFRDVMSDIYEQVKGGEMLSAAMAKRPDVFNEVFIGLIAAGEKTGNMSASFGHLSHHLKWNNDLRRSIKKAMSYPIALILVMTGVISLMMIFVIPQLVDFLESQGFDLPIHTRALIATSEFFVNYWYMILGIPILFLIIMIMLYKNSSTIRYRIDSILLKSPFIGIVILKINLARFSHFFAITFSSGIGVLDCLDTARKVIGNMVIKEAVTFIIQNVSEGNSLTGAISSTQRFPSLVVRMFKVGEDSGNMDDALKNINFFYDREVEDSVARMISVLQPTITIVMGAIMFWVVAAVFGPLYGSFSEIDF